MDDVFYGHSGYHNGVHLYLGIVKAYAARDADLPMASAEHCGEIYLNL